MWYLGPVVYIIFFWLGSMRGVEPIHQYYFLFAWVPFLWTLDRLLRRRDGHGFVNNGKELLGLLFFSTTYWMVFEALNLRLRDWSYYGFPTWLPERWIYTALTFSTVVPGVLWTASLLSRPVPPIAPKVIKPWLTVGVGVVMFALPMIWPQWFFPLVWGCFFFLCEPLVQRLGGHSLINDWKAGRWHTTVSLCVAGLICGLFWEFNNYWAGAKWIYHLPYWNFGKVFEMPALGYIGYPPFALELFVVYQATVLVWRRLSVVGKAAMIFCATCFCLWTLSQL